MNDKDIKQIQEKKVEEMTKDEIFEAMKILNINEGEQIKKEFSQYKRFGIVVKKEGRISYKAFAKTAPTLIDAIKNIDEAPGDFINIICPKLISGDVDYNEMNKDEIEISKKILKESHALEQKGVVINSNLIWEVWKIIRGEACEKIVKEAGLPIEQLQEIYSYLTDDQVQEIRAKYKTYFN